MHGKHDVSEPTLSPHDPYRLTENELNSGYDDDELWGLYLYKKHTNLGRYPISSEVAATMSERDLEAILDFTFVSSLDLENDKNVSETVENCSRELAVRDAK